MDGLTHNVPRPDPPQSTGPSSSNDTTTIVLLERLRTTGSHDDWDAFDRRYRPVVLAVARRIGLRPEDAADVAQQTILEFFAGWRRGDYDPARGRLRTWLVAVVRHRAIDLLRRPETRRVRPASDLGDGVLEEATNRPGAGVIREVPDARALTDFWDAEMRRAILVESIARLRAEPPRNPRALETFERCTLRGEPYPELARVFGISVDEIYRLKHDVLRRLRTIIDAVEATWNA